MAFPTSVDFTTGDLDAGTDSPNAARAQLYILAQQVAAMILSANLPSGVAVLDESGLLLRDIMPYFENAVQTLSIQKGGTGATNAADARANLGLDLALVLSVGGQIGWGPNAYFTYDGTDVVLYKNGIPVQTW